jgi:hypothetical protein
MRLLEQLKLIAEHCNKVRNPCEVALLARRFDLLGGMSSSHTAAAGNQTFERVRFHAYSGGVFRLRGIAQFGIEDRRVLEKKPSHLDEQFRVAAKPGKCSFNIQDASGRYTLNFHTFTIAVLGEVAVPIAAIPYIIPYHEKSANPLVTIRSQLERKRRSSSIDTMLDRWEQFAIRTMVVRARIVAAAGAHLAGDQIGDASRLATSVCEFPPRDGELPEYLVGDATDLALSWLVTPILG